jgi:hypothetical protein
LLLDALPLEHIGEIADRATQPQSHGRENMFAAPSRCDRLGGKFLRSLDIAASFGRKSASTSRRHVSASSAT